MNPWNRLLADPGPEGHVAQLYHEDTFLVDAVAHFAAEGFAKGESVILVPMKSHWDLISGRLVDQEYDLADLARQGQLTVLDAQETLPKFMVGPLPDAGLFKGLAQATIQKARAGGRFPRVRWWGEIVNELYLAGHIRASIRLEELCDELAHEEKVAIFCSFLMNSFDPTIYDGPLQDVCRTHSDLIPARSYPRHRACVDQAFSEVFGPPNAQALGPLVAESRWASPGMPFSQALLLWLKDVIPDQAVRLLASALRHAQEPAVQKKPPEKGPSLEPRNPRRSGPSGSKGAVEPAPGVGGVGAGCRSLAVPIADLGSSV